MNLLLFCDTQLKNLYKIPKSGGYSYISANADLRLLIKFIMNYPHQIGVKNALIFGLLTGLRSSNVRNLTHEHLKIGDDGEYYLLFPQDENKVKSNGDEHLGLPTEVGQWLQRLHAHNSSCPLCFANTQGEVLSDMTLVKALKTYAPVIAKNRLVFHSFRKILETFAYEKIHENKLDPYSIERTLFHAQKEIQKIYNKATNIENTRRVLTWWLGYLKGLGFKF
nr:tyrosine-type recombinase/integrase [uncultured Campylobacter sp.]